MFSWCKGTGRSLYMRRWMTHQFQVLSALISVMEDDLSSAFAFIPQIFEDFWKIDGYVPVRIDSSTILKSYLLVFYARTIFVRFGSSWMTQTHGLLFRFALISLHPWFVRCRQHVSKYCGCIFCTFACTDRLVHFFWSIVKIIGFPMGANFPTP